MNTITLEQFTCPTQKTQGPHGVIGTVRRSIEHAEGMFPSRNGCASRRLVHETVEVVQICGIYYEVLHERNGGLTVVLAHDDKVPDDITQPVKARMEALALKCERGEGLSVKEVGAFRDFIDKALEAEESVSLAAQRIERLAEGGGSSVTEADAIRANARLILKNCRLEK